MYFLRHIKSIIKDSKGLNFVEIFFLAEATLFLLGFSKYEFQNKLLGNVTLLRVIIYIYIYTEKRIRKGCKSRYRGCKGPNH